MVWNRKCEEMNREWTVTGRLLLTEGEHIINIITQFEYCTKSVNIAGAAGFISLLSQR